VVGTRVSSLCCTHGIRSATFNMWRSKFGGMDASMVARMSTVSRIKELEYENRRL
jgi:putative transposase